MPFSAMALCNVTLALDDLDLTGSSVRKGRAASFWATVSLAGIVMGMGFGDDDLMGATVFEEGLSFFSNWDVLSMLMYVQGILLDD